MIPRARWYWLVLCLPLGLAACGKEEKKSEPAPTAPPAPTWKVDKALDAQIRELAKSCQVDTARVTVRCQDGKNRTLVQEFLTDKRSRTDSLETFVALLEEKDEKVVAVAASLLYDIDRSGLGDKAEGAAVSPKVAAGFREQFVKREGPYARLLAPTVAHTASLSGQLKELDEALDGKQQLQSTAYRYTMVHGRLAAFEKIKELTKSEHSSVRLAALEAPRNMKRWTPKDRSTICPWAQSLLGDERPMVATRAATLLSRCSGDSVDMLLQNGEEAAKAGQFGRGMLPAYRDLCSGMRRRSGGGATKEQCERNRKLLVGVAEDSKAQGQLRALALSAIAYQWPDDASLALAKKLGREKQPELTKTAEQTVSRLERRHEAERRAGRPTAGTNQPKVGSSDTSEKPSGSTPGEAPQR